MKSPATVHLTELLMEEHGLIKRGIVVLARLCAHLRRDGSLDHEAASDLLRFIKLYADEHHHAKEEYILFPWMQTNGFLPGAGPIEVMLSDHVQARVHMGDLTQALHRLRSARDDKDARRRFIQAGESYATLLYEHIWKEDNILYPMADRLGTGTAGIYDPTGDPTRDPLAIESEYRALIAQLEELASDWPKEDVQWDRGCH